jgi:hypothetical protein
MSVQQSHRYLSPNTKEALRQDLRLIYDTTCVTIKIALKHEPGCMCNRQEIGHADEARAGE